ncbi:hypothetical protein QFC19_002743 [Naganishia cerealis]|uniref:Uncharacterized protein n=1 Tax=Naganishia cerealis TaxID=610337 RepID=A0ACC2WB89_9TREE|nr:hypothetical protein QFC19_002743 [Naganishia cerealis]
MDNYTYTRKSDIERHIRRAQKEERFRRRQARLTTGKIRSTRKDDDVFGPTTTGINDHLKSQERFQNTAIERADKNGDRNSGEDEDNDDDDDDDLEPPGSDDEEYTYEVAEFEVNLKHWIECLNIHGNAIVASSSSHNTRFAADGDGSASTSGAGGRGKKRWIMDDDEPIGGRGFGSIGGGRERDVRNTSLIMTWQGEGEPLTLLL